MKENEIISSKKNDNELIKIEFPKNPCNECVFHYTGCEKDCSSLNKYYKKLEEYNEKVKREVCFDINEKLNFFNEAINNINIKDPCTICSSRSKNCEKHCVSKDIYDKDILFFEKLKKFYRDSSYEEKLEIFEDFLNKVSPINPCSGECYSKNCISDCEKMINYERLIKTWKILNANETIKLNKERLSLIKDIDDKMKKIREIEESLPNFLLSTKNSSRTNSWQASIRKDKILTCEEFINSLGENNDSLISLEEIQTMVDDGIINIDYDKLEKYLLSNKKEK